ncbi:efflux RND transporter periplasmic adaptor subunit [Salinarimonas soli]|uniref:Efflux RND transporter periplasmic adaptor subunit n=1 Tax=Salinarimonas soli TaxID=1638099 RepID=A0A5B2VIJ0_9HYPH|nr:efflux RND transporter periplasmic adaptor subunit [Salinarimonas soli]KAA2238139.1 efflux RND transporter periplasmic adaptor subunit [Salinarimonas soli]
MRQPPAFVLALALAAVASGAVHAQAPAGPPPVSVAKPVVKEIKEWDDFIGRFEAVNEVEVRARVSGYLDKIHFMDGTPVKVGDPLFTIDQRPYKAALEQAEATVASAQTRVEFAENDLERAETLRKTGNIPEQVLDQRRTNYLTARAELDRAEAARRQARLDMEFTEIKAPVAGRISRRLVSLGNLVNANQTVLTNVVSTNPIYFYFDVDERSYLAYARTASGARSGATAGAGAIPVTVALTGENDPTRKGRLDFIDNRIDQASGTIRARALIENDDSLLAPGLFGRIRIPGSQPYKGVLLPDEAIGNDQDRRVVFLVAEDGTVQARPVRPGPRIDGYRVIREGLKGDETVVVNGLMRVRAGQKVQPHETTLPPTRERAGS